MIRSGILGYFAVIFALLGGVASFGADVKPESPQPAEFQEVYGVLRAHLSGVSEAELNRAAVEGLISALGPKVWLLTNSAAQGEKNSAPLVNASSVLEGNFAWIRVERVGENLEAAVREAYARISATNKVKGVILDLRYAGGRDYAAAVATADLFLKTERPLLDWGEGMKQSKEKSQCISAPVAVLVNAGTAAAAEALAAILRETGTGLILGRQTAGMALKAEEFALQNGDRLLIAAGPIHLGDGSTLSGAGLKPDISIEVSAQDERGNYADAYRVAGKTDPAGGAASSANAAGSTNRPPRRLRVNEAELVRERREGLSEADLAGDRDREPEKPVISDPVLARAVDLLKGLALVRESRS